MKLCWEAMGGRSGVMCKGSSYKIWSNEVCDKLGHSLILEANYLLCVFGVSF